MPSEDEPSTQATLAPDWTILFTEAGLDPSQWKHVDTRGNPLFYADTKAAWEGSFPSQPTIPVRIEAGALHGKPVFFEIKGPWISKERIGLVQQLAAANRGALSRVVAYALISAISLAGGLFFGPNDLLSYTVGLILSTCVIFLLMRFGLAASLICYIFTALLGNFPTTLDASAWYSSYGYAVLAVFAAIVLYAFRFSLGGRPLPPRRLKDETIRARIMLPMKYCTFSVLYFLCARRFYGQKCDAAPG